MIEAIDLRLIKEPQIAQIDCLAKLAGAHHGPLCVVCVGFFRAWSLIGTRGGEQTERGSCLERLGQYAHKLEAEVSRRARSCVEHAFIHAAQDNEFGEAADPAEF